MNCYFLSVGFLLCHKQNGRHYSQRAKSLSVVLLDQKLRSNDETCEVNELALKITQAIQPCVNRFAPEKLANSSKENE